MKQHPQTRVHNRQVDKGEELLAFRMLLQAQTDLLTNPDEQHAILARQLQSASRLTVGFWNIRCEM